MRIKTILLVLIAASCWNLTANAKKTELLPVAVNSQQDNTVMAHYWIELDDPKGWNLEDKDRLEALVKEWNVQEALRKNAPAYTNLIMEDGTRAKVKFRKEQITNPDGDTICPGMLHYHPEIPNCGAIYEVVAPTQVEAYRQGVLVTDEYLKNHKLFTLSDIEPWDTEVPLPADIVKALEQRYGMEVSESHQLCRIDGRYIYGSAQFKGEWKDAPKQKYNPDRKYCLAVNVLADGAKLYVNEQAGFYDSETDFGWNVDDCGVYSGYPVVAAFEGEDGPVLCYYHLAPESTSVGIFSAAGDRLNQEFATYYQNMIDEEIPVWKSDLATMERLYKENAPDNAPIKFTQWTYVFVGYDVEAIWANNGGEALTGAIFQRKDGKLSLIAETGRNRKPAFGMIDDKGYLSVSGSAGGPSWYREIYVFQDGKLVETFTCLEVYGNIDVCTLNGKEISAEEGNAYMAKLPEFKALDPYFKIVE